MMPRRRRGTVPRRTLLIAGVLGGFGLLGGVAAAPAAQIQAAQAKATIDNLSFSPAVLTVAVGTRVTWTNRDDIPHTVTDAATPRTMKSPPLDTGESFAFTFDKPGAYAYFCSLHPHMQGTVVVH